MYHISFSEHFKKIETMPQIREEIYDNNGLIEVVFHEVEGPTQEELIAKKEAQLLAMYEELKALKG